MSFVSQYICWNTDRQTTDKKINRKEGRKREKETDQMVWKIERKEEYFIKDRGEDRLKERKTGRKVDRKEDRQKGKIDRDIGR
jgi:hypothetical protein